MPRLQTAVLCNAATVEQSGLVSMLGAFVDTITGAAAPVRQQLWLVTRILFEPSEVSTNHEIAITVASGDGPPLAQVHGVVRPEPTPGLDPDFLAGAPIVVPLPIEFPEPGLYHVTFTLNGDLLWDAPLRVKLLDQ